MIHLLKKTNYIFQLLKNLLGIWLFTIYLLVYKLYFFYLYIKTNYFFYFLTLIVHRNYFPIVQLNIWQLKNPRLINFNLKILMKTIFFQRLRERDAFLCARRNERRASQWDRVVSKTQLSSLILGVPNFPGPSSGNGTGAGLGTRARGIGGPPGVGMGLGGGPGMIGRAGGFGPRGGAGPHGTNFLGSGGGGPGAMRMEKIHPHRYNPIGMGGSGSGNFVPSHFWWLSFDKDESRGVNSSSQQSPFWRQSLPKPTCRSADVRNRHIRHS